MLFSISKPWKQFSFWQQTAPLSNFGGFFVIVVGICIDHFVNTGPEAFRVKSFLFLNLTYIIKS